MKWQVQNLAETFEVSPTEADAVVQMAIDGQPELLVIRSPSHHELLIGVSGCVAVAHFTHADQPDIFFVPMCDDAEEIIAFSFSDQRVEVPRKFCVNIELLREVVSEFFREDRRPVAVHWQVF